MSNTISFLSGRKGNALFIISLWKISRSIFFTATVRSYEFNVGISCVTIEKSDYSLYLCRQVISLSDVALVWRSEHDASRFFNSHSLSLFHFFSVNIVTLLSTWRSYRIYTLRYWSPLGAPGKKDTIDNPRSSVILGTRSGTPSGVSLREEKERAVTYQELIHAEGTSERRESAGSGGPQGITGCEGGKKRGEKSDRRGQKG